MRTANSLGNPLIRKLNLISFNNLLTHNHTRARALNRATGRSDNPVVIDQSPVTVPLTRKFDPSGRDFMERERARVQAIYGRGGSDDMNQSPVTIPLTRKFNPTSGHNILKLDRARAQAFRDQCPGKPLDPDGRCNILKYDQARARAMQNGEFGGGSLPMVIHSLLGDASLVNGYRGTYGNFNVGSRDIDLANDALIPNPIAIVQMVTDNLFNQNIISAKMIGVFFAPTTADSAENGGITFGGTDSSKFAGPISFTPVTTTSPANKYWGIDQSMSYGGTTILSSTAGIVDTGTTLVLLATDAFKKYKKATGAVSDRKTGFLRITPTQYTKLQSLFLTTNGVTFELTKNAQIWPRSLNTAIGGVDDEIYLIVADIGGPSGKGLDFINGYAFLERFYSAFDTTNKQVGFATTAFTYATSN